jgi:hypothetical protein
MAAQRNSSMAPQMAINTTTIFQCFFEKRFVGIRSSLCMCQGSVAKYPPKYPHAWTELQNPLKPVEFVGQNQYQSSCRNNIQNDNGST